MIKKGLGKGLDAFFPPSTLKDIQTTTKIQSEMSEGVNEVEIEKIITNENQPRKIFNEKSIEELSDSIKKYGVIQPIVLVKKNDKYELIAGERRLRAAKMAGLTKIPSVIKEYDKKTQSEIALIENIQRQDLNILEQAQAYKDIIEKYNISQEELAKNIGKSRSSISNLIRILKFSDDIKEHILKNEMSEGHCKVLVSVQDEVLKNKLVDKIINQGMSVRQLEDYIKQINDSTGIKKDKKEEEKNVWITDIEEKLKDIFQTKVEVKAKNNKGKIIVEYYSNDELDRILEVINRR